MRLNIDLTQGKIKRNVFFTSDLHLFHNNVIRFDNRPFTSIQEMHKVIEERWNETVKPEDYVINLGDLSFAKKEDKPVSDSIVSRLNGTQHYVLGNHDKLDDIKKIGKFETIQDYLELRISHYNDIGIRIETAFYCMHYPIYSWNKSHRGTYMVHGHCHGNLHHGEDANFYVNRRVMDVGCMLTDYRPISYLDVMDKLSHIILPELKSN